MQRRIRLAAIFSIIFCLCLMVACKVTTSTSHALTVQKAVLAHVSKKGVNCNVKIPRKCN